MRTNISFLLFGLLLALGLSISSCTDMTEDTTGQMTAENFYADPNLVRLAVGTAYSELQGYQNHWGIWGLQTVSSDECVVPTRLPGNDWYDGGVWQAFHKHEWATNLDALNTVWISCFSGISTCNRVIYDLDAYKETMDDDVYQKYRAEASVLHCLYYSFVLDLFGNVPFVNTYEQEITAYTQTSRGALFDAIVESLEANIDYLDDEPTAENYGHVTKSAANQLLAKLYLNKKIYKAEETFSVADMNKVVEYCDKIINSGFYSIADDFKDPFVVHNESCKENIFVVPMSPGISTKGTDYEFHFHWFSGHSRFRQIYGYKTGGWNGGCATPSFMDLYEDTDYRKRATFKYGECFTPEGDTVFNPHLKDANGKPVILNLTIEIDGIASALRWQGARIQKYEYEKGMTSTMENDFVLYRLADVYYMKAEAILRGATNANLANLLDQPEFQKIRTRAEMPIYTTATLTLDELIDERGREFAWEGMRRTDLIRWDKFAKGSWSFKEALTDNTRDLFPIPYKQIQTNPTWVQNPGY
jgi:hypothetical protein